MTSQLEALERLANLRDRGVLSEDEFSREKANLLDNEHVVPLGGSPSPKSPEPKASASPEGDSQKLGYAKRLAASRAVEQKMWSFGPISDVETGTLLLSGGWLAFWLITGDGLIDVARNFGTALSGGVVDPAVANGEALMTSIVGFMIYTTITLVVALLAVRRRSRIAASLLIILALLELFLALGARWDDSRTLAHAAFLICIPAAVLGLQCLRAAIALRTMSRT